MIVAQLVGGVVAAYCVHEAGHAAAAKLVWLPWRLTWTRHGPAVTVGRADINLTRSQVRITNAAGPLFNVLLGAVCYGLGLGIVVAVNLDFIVFNLLPFPYSDGMRILMPGRAIRLAREAEAR